MCRAHLRNANLALLLGVIQPIVFCADVRAVDHVKHFWDATKARSASVHSARITWRQTELQAAAAMGERATRAPLPNAEPAEKEPKGNEGFPSRDIVVHDVVSVTFDRARIISSIQNTRHPEFARRCAYTDGISRWLTAQPNAHPVGVIDSGGGSPHAKLTTYQPVFKSFRACDAPFSSLQKLALKDKGRTGVIGGATCCILEAVGTGRPILTLHSLWVDPAADYNIRRYTTQQGDRPTIQMDIAYARDERIGWYPNGWTIQTFTAKGSLATQVTAADVKMEVNLRLDNDDFQLDFPIGAAVTDKRNGQRYVIQPNQVLRPVLPADRGATHAQLMASEPGRANVRTSPSRFFVILNFAIVIVLVALFIFRRIRLYH